MREKWETEFFKLAGFMLMCRFQVVHGEMCTYHKGHQRKTTKLIFHQLSYVGYKDSIGEMNIMLKEMKGDTNNNS